MHTYTYIFSYKCLTYTLSRSFLQTEQFAVLWILFTIIVLGNSAVLFVMFINKNRKSRMNYFIKQLALAGESAAMDGITPAKNVLTLTYVYLLIPRSLCGTTQCTHGYHMAHYNLVAGWESGLQGHSLLAGVRHILLYVCARGHEH